MKIICHECDTVVTIDESQYNNGDIAKGFCPRCGALVSGIVETSKLEMPPTQKASVVGEKSSRSSVFPLSQGTEQEEKKDSENERIKAQLLRREQELMRREHELAKRYAEINQLESSDSEDEDDEEDNEEDEVYLDSIHDVSFQVTDKGGVAVNVDWCGEENKFYQLKVLQKKSSKNNYKKKAEVSSVGNGYLTSTTLLIEDYDLSLDHDKITSLDFLIELQQNIQHSSYVTVDTYQITLKFYHYFNFFSKSITRIES